MLAREGWSERPMAVLDLDAFDANAEDLARRAAGTPLRVASKSLRVRGLLERVLARPGYAGILAFTLPEALWLVRHGVRDVVVAYPTAERAAVRRLAASPEALEAITLMVDETAQLDLLLDALATVGRLAGLGHRQHEHEVDDGCGDQEGDDRGDHRTEVDEGRLIVLEDLEAEALDAVRAARGGDDRVDEVVDEGGDQRGERAADHDTDREVDDIALHDEVLEALHGVILKGSGM